MKRKNTPFFKTWKKEQKTLTLRKTNMILLSQLILNKTQLFRSLSLLSSSKKLFREKNQNYPPTIPGDFYLFRRHCRFNFLIIRKKTEDKRKIECEKKNTPGAFRSAITRSSPRSHNVHNIDEKIKWILLLLVHLCVCHIFILNCVFWWSWASNCVAALWWLLRFYKWLTFTFEIL